MNDRYRCFRHYISGKKVLDIGVVQHDIENVGDRENWIHRLIRRDAGSVKGIDIDKEGVEYLKGRGFDVEVCDAQNFDLHEEYDVVVAGELIEHLTNFDGFLKSVKKHLNENGLFIVTTPNPWFLRRTLQVLVRGEAKVNPEHTCWFDEVTLRQLLGRHGFGVKEFGYAYTKKWGKLARVIPLPKRLKANYIVAIFKRLV